MIREKGKKMKGHIAAANTNIAAREGAEKHAENSKNGKGPTLPGKNWGIGRSGSVSSGLEGLGAQIIRMKT